MKTSDGRRGRILEFLGLFLSRMRNASRGVLRCSFLYVSVGILASLFSNLSTLWFSPSTNTGREKKTLSTCTKKKKKSAVECKYIYPSMALLSIFHFAQLRTFISEADVALFSSDTFTWQLKFSIPSFFWGKPHTSKCGNSERECSW